MQRSPAPLWLCQWSLRGFICQTAGHLRLARHLPPERARVAQHLQVLGLGRASIPALGVKACHRTGADEERIFFRSFLGCAMAMLVEKRDVYRHAVTDRAMVAGLFVVPWASRVQGRAGNVGR